MRMGKLSSLTTSPLDWLKFVHQAFRESHIHMILFCNMIEGTYLSRQKSTVRIPQSYQALSSRTRKRKWAWGQGYPDPARSVKTVWCVFFPGFLCMAIRHVQLDHFLLHQHSHCRIQHWSSVTTMNWFIKPWGVWILPFLKVCMYSVRVWCVLWKCMITAMTTFSG